MTTTLDIAPAYESMLRAAGLARLEDFMNAPCGATTSKHDTRETAPLELRDASGVKRFFLKRAFKVPAAHAILPWLRGQRGFSQPMVEWQMLGELEARDIPAMKRVAVGEERSLGRPTRAFLLVEEVPMCQTLEHWLVPGFDKPQDLSIRQRRELLQSLGRLIGKLHGSAFRWPDIHAKHVFARRIDAMPGSAKWEFCLIDVERMTRLNRTDTGELDEAAQRDLRALLRSVTPAPISHLDLLAFTSGYLKMSHSKGDDWPKWARLESMPRLPDDYEHPPSVPLARVSKMYVDKRAIGSLGEMGISSMKDVFALKSGRSLDKPGLASFRQRLELTMPGENGRPGTIFLKRYDRPPIIEQIRRMLATGMFHATAYHETRFIKKLSMLGIPTVRSLAFGQKMRGPLETRSVSITHGLVGVSLESLLAEVKANRRSPQGNRERREIAVQLGLLVAAMHRHRLFHRDLYLSHVFLTHNADGRIVLRVIDLARMIEKPLRTQRWRIKDLAALAYSAGEGPVTRTDRLRFSRAYYGGEFSRESLHLDLSEINAKLKRITRHDQRRKSRLAGEKTS